MKDFYEIGVLWLGWENGESYWAEREPGERAEAERIYEEVRAEDPERTHRLLGKPGILKPALAELLLEKSRALLFAEPEEAEFLAGMAAVIAGQLESAGVVEGELAATFLTRASWLTGNAQRLRGIHDRAERTFRLAAFTLPLSLEAFEHGFYLRSVALLRWERGQVGEAAALLRKAVGIFGGRSIEEAVCHSLLGTLLVEEGDVRAGVRQLVDGPRRLRADQDSWLALRSRLAQAYGQALLRDTKDAARILRETRVYSRKLDSSAAAQEWWWRGRLDCVLGKPERAAQRLARSARWFLDQRDLTAAALVMVDLAYALAELGRREEMTPFVERLGSTFAAEEGLGGILARLRRCGEAGATHEERMAGAWADAWALRRLLRMKDHVVETLPFV